MKNWLFVSCALLSAGWFFAAPSICTAAANVGVVNALSGKVENFHKEAKKPEIMQVGSKIYEHDRIVTGKDGTVQIVFRDDSSATLGPSSELVIDADTYNGTTGKRETLLSLIRGKLRSVVGKTYSQGNSRYEVHTATAIAGVRGTENLVDATQSLTTIYGIENTTNARNVNPDVKGDVNLGPKRGARVRPNEPPDPFDFDFEDPAFIEVINQTTLSGGSDVEDDILMDSLGNDMGDVKQDIPSPEFGPDRPLDEPPYEEEPPQEPQRLYDHSDDHGYQGGY